MPIFSRNKHIRLKLADNYLKIPTTTLTALLILFFLPRKTALAQHDTLKLNSDWNAGVLVLKDQKGRITRANLRGDQLWIRDRVKVLTPAERGALLSIVASKNQLPVFGE